MKNKTSIALAVGIVVVLGGVLWFYMASDPTDNTSMQSQSTPESESLPVNEQSEASTAEEGPVEEPGLEESSQAGQSLADGRYVAYDSSLVDDLGYEQTILFFHAEWCPECRAFDQDINANTVPEGVQILKVDYDTATNLREQYGITIQTSFVSVDSRGSQVTKWVGYGQERTLDALLQNI